MGVHCLLTRIQFLKGNRKCHNQLPSLCVCWTSIEAVSLGKLDWWLVELSENAWNAKIPSNVRQRGCLISGHSVVSALPTVTSSFEQFHHTNVCYFFPVNFNRHHVFPKNSGVCNFDGVQVIPCLNYLPHLALSQAECPRVHHCVLYAVPTQELHVPTTEYPVELSPSMSCSPSSVAERRVFKVFKIIILEVYL